MEQHSPTPWRIDSMEPFAEEPDALVDVAGECVIYFAEGIDDEMMGDIQHIIRCVNAHDGLVKVLREMLAIGCEECTHSDYAAPIVIRAAHAALAQLE